MGKTRVSFYTAETEVGMVVFSAKSLEEARNQVRREIGTFFDIYTVRKSTEEDISWYRTMGGRLE